MNERQPYEKHLADKLQHLPAPSGANRSWEQMRAILDKELPRGGSSGGSGGGGRWWIFGAMTALVFLGTWLTGKQFSPPNHRRSATAAASANDSSVRATGSPPMASLPVTAPESTAAKPVLSYNEQPSAKNNNKPLADDSILHNNPSSDNTVTNTAGAGKTPGNNHTTTGNSTGDHTVISENAAGNNSVPAGNAATASKPGNNTLPSNKTPVSHSNPSRTSHSRTRSRGDNTKPSTADVARNNRSPKNKPGNNRNSTAITSNHPDRSRYTQSNNRSNTGRGAGNIAATNKKQQGNNQQKTGYSAGKEAPVSSNNNAVTTPVQRPLNSSLVAVPSVAGIVPEPASVLEDSVTANYNDYVNTMFPAPPVAATANRKKGRSFGEGAPGTFAIGITLPMNLPINDQVALGLNRNARPNTLSDFLPSLNLQYRLTTHAFVQAEVQFSSPQYISPLLMYQRKQDLPFTASYAYTSISARKLYYFNLPLTVHYSPVPGLYLGAGIQYSALLSGVALSEKKQSWGGGPGGGPREMTIKYEYSKFSHDSLSCMLKSTDWRLVLDFNYYWNRFTVGFRYNQGLSDYADFRIANSPYAVRDKNKATQFYVRYNIWEDRKRNNRKSNKNLLTFK